MKSITELSLIENLSSKGVLLVLFGRPACGVCQSIRPQLKAMLHKHFPVMQSVYVDCETSPEICAQFSVFSLPVVKVFIEDKLIVEEFGSFSISELKEKLDRPYSMWLA